MTKQWERVSIYVKSIAISEEDLAYIKATKSKKSAAGKLAEIINFYKELKKYA
jgi:hypothetical protein